MSNDTPHSAAMFRASPEIGALPIRKDIIQLSAPHAVSMGESWFDFVSQDNFWLIRRYQVLQKIAKPLLDPRLRYCEVGCGNGILQQQLEQKSGLKVDGFDLCLSALQQNQSRKAALYYYNVFDQRSDLAEKYDVLFLFDVLEHIEAEIPFIKACFHHIKPGGSMILNVPAREELRSKYDRLAGHFHRYKISKLIPLVEEAGTGVASCTYWGLPLYPLLLLRKIMLSRVQDVTAFKIGMQPANSFINFALQILSQCEVIPQRLLGTSIMMVLNKNS